MQNPRQVILKDLPLQAGQAVEVLVLVKAEIPAQSAQEIAPRRPKKSKAEIRQLLAATRGGSIPFFLVQTTVRDSSEKTNNFNMLQRPAL